MCGRFTQQRSDHELAQLFDAEPLTDEAGGRFNLAPTDPAAVVVEHAGRRALTQYRWGLVPHRATSATIAARHINARAETLASSRVFRESFEHRRCLVPADGFYEWRRDERGRQPFLVRDRTGLPLAFAGLWSGWRDRSTGVLRRTFTIITTTPNELVSSLHDRMPVILPPDAWATWLDPDLADVGELHGLLVPAPDVSLETYPVDTLVNNVRNNGPALVVPLAEGRPA